MILLNHFTFWWKKESKFTVEDDIRFVTGMLGTKEPGVYEVIRITYPLVKRTGISIRFKNNWHFFGILTFGDKKNTRDHE